MHGRAENFCSEHLIDHVQSALIDSLSKTKMGDPKEEGVRMGALVTVAQKEEVLRQVENYDRSGVCLPR